MNSVSGSSIKTVAVTLVAAVSIPVILLALSSEDPLQSITFFFTGPFQSTYNLGNMLDNTAMLILTGLGMSIAFRAGTFNLGGEGQVYAGAITAVIISLNIGNTAGFTGIVIVLTAGLLTGALIAGISGFLKKQWNTDELISTFLLSGAIIHLTDFLIANPFRDRSSFLISTEKIPEKLFLYKLMGSSHLNISFFLSIAAVFLAYIFLFKSTTGYEIRLTGLNRKFVEYGGIPYKRHLVIPMLISGGMYGLAGSFSVLGNFHMGIKGFTAGLGWNGIAVTLIAGNNPIFIIPGALIFAYLEAGTEVAMIHSDLSFEFSNLIKAVIFFLITAKRFKLRRKVTLG